MKVYVLLMIALVGPVFSEDEIAKDGNILVLTKDNFDSAIAKHKPILVEFYAEWCGACKALVPEYKAAADMLEEEGSKIKLAKVDAIAETELADRFDVRGYPTIKLFKDEEIIEHRAGRFAEDLVAWLNKKTTQPAKNLATIEDVKSFIQDDEVAIVGFFPNAESSEAKAFIEVADSIDEAVFGIVSNANIAKKYEIHGNGIILFKQFDERRVVFTGKYESDTISNFVDANRLPLVNQMVKRKVREIQTRNVRIAYYLFLSSSANNFPEILCYFNDIAKEFKGKIVFAYYDVDNEESAGAHLGSLGVEDDDIFRPTVRILDRKSREKFKPDQFETLTRDVVRKFARDFVDGKIKPFKLTQEIPDDWDKEPVKVLVRKNFNEIALDKSKNVFVEFYAPWCAHCKELAPVWDELAEKFKKDKSLVIAKIDATKNEIDNVEVRGLPTLKWFPKNSGEVVDYTGEKTLEDLTTFVESDGKVIPAKEEKKDEL
ncbi:protein disulfide-isomerase 2-like [Dendronephthya gigantea]|uniref:protein disulfide-isomerase 2-like n=1 Tax=Dendronephthya gigantea TaxID=151771 RepID=UPI0010697AB5|nr:protein disulfide-isomerase 2-like [Dendronephthya gigantea]